MKKAAMVALQSLPAFHFINSRSLSSLSALRVSRLLQFCKDHPLLDSGTHFSAHFVSFVSASMSASSSLVEPAQLPIQQQSATHKAAPLELAEYSFEGISIGGQETCIMVPKLKIAFDIGRCPQRAISQDFLFISHGHMDHIGGIAMYVATRGLYRMKPPTVIVPKCIKETVEKLFGVYRQLDGSELAHRLVALDVGESYDLGKGLLAKAFKTYHVIPSQGYIIYSVRRKLKPEYIGRSGNEIKDLKESGVEITNLVMIPEVAYTGDTMADFIVDDNNKDVLSAKVLIMEATFVDESIPVEHAREYGHTHLCEVAALADRFQNKGILLVHFSARYKVEEIKTAINSLPRALQEQTVGLLNGF